MKIVLVVLLAGCVGYSQAEQCNPTKLASQILGVRRVDRVEKERMDDMRYFVNRILVSYVPKLDNIASWGNGNGTEGEKAQVKQALLQELDQKIKKNNDALVSEIATALYEVQGEYPAVAMDTAIMGSEQLTGVAKNILQRISKAISDPDSDLDEIKESVLYKPDFRPYSQACEFYWHAWGKARYCGYSSDFARPSVERRIQKAACLSDVAEEISEIEENYAHELLKQTSWYFWQKYTPEQAQQLAHEVMGAYVRKIRAERQ